MNIEDKYLQVMRTLEEMERNQRRSGLINEVMELRRAMAAMRKWHEGGFQPSQCPVDLTHFNLPAWDNGQAQADSSASVGQPVRTVSDQRARLQVVMAMLSGASSVGELRRALDEARSITDNGYVEPNLQKAILVAEERLRSLSTPPSRTPPSNAEAVPGQTPMPATESEQIDRWLTDAGNAVDSGDYERAIRLCQQVLDQDEYHPKASSIRKTALARKEKAEKEARIRECTRALNEADDEHLLEAIHNAETLEVDAPPELINALMRARERLNGLGGHDQPDNLGDWDMPDEDEEMAAPAVDFVMPDAMNTGTDTVDGLLQRARTALDNGLFDEAIEFCQIILSETPNHPEAASLRQTAVIRKNLVGEERRLENLRKKLRETDDMTLEWAIREVEALAAEGKAPHDLTELLKRARPRFNRIRTERRMRTTAEAMGAYEEIHQTILLLTEDMNKGVSEWPDDRLSGANRPVVDLLQEFRLLATEKVGEYFDRLIDLADQDRVKHPIQAQNRYSEAQTLEGLSVPQRDNLDRLARENAQAVQMWTVAEESLREARRPDLSPEAAYSLFITARNSYPQHEDLERVAGLLTDRYCLQFNTEMDRKLAQATVLFREGKFDEILRLLDSPPTLPEHLPSASGYEKRLNKWDLYKKAAQHGQRMAAELRQGKPAAATAIYNDLPQAIIDLGLLEDMHGQALLAQNDTGGLVEAARRDLDAKRWDEAYQKLHRISESGEYGRTQVRPLRIRAQMGMCRQAITENLAQRRYDRVQDALNELWAIPDLPAADRQRLDEEFADLQADLDRRRRNDPDAMAQINRAKAVQEDRLKGDKRFEEAYEILRQAAEIESCLVGDIRDRQVEVLELMYASLHTRLTKAAKANDHTTGVELIRVMDHYNLVRTEEDAGNRKKLLRLSYLQQEEELTGRRQAGQVVQLWMNALGQYPNELEFHKKLEAAQLQWLIHRVDEQLDGGNFAEGMRLLREENTFGVQSSLGLDRFDIHSQPELVQRLRAAEILIEAERLYQREEYGSMVKYLEGMLAAETKPLPVVGRYLQRQREQAVQTLIQRGDALMEKGETPEAVIEYSEALSVNPDDSGARARIQANLGSLRVEINRRITRAGQFAVGQNSSVETQLDDGNRLLLSLRNLLVVLKEMGNEREDMDRRLNNAINQVNLIISQLNELKDKLDSLGPDAEAWRAALRSGNFFNVVGITNSLARDLSVHHPQVVELTQRKQKYERLRTQLENALDLMDQHYRDEKHGEALHEVSRAEALVRESALHDNPDPFGLIMQKGLLQDVVGGRTVAGLAQIRVFLKDCETNYQAWVDWCAHLDRLVEKLVNGLERVNTLFNPDKPTEAGYTALVTTCALQEQIQAILDNQPETPPMTTGGQDLYEGALVQAEQVNALFVELNQRLADYESSRGSVNYEAMMDEATEHINNENYSLALPILERLLIYRPGDETVEFYRQVCQYPPGRRRKFLGIF